MLDPVPFGGEVDVEYEIRINNERLHRYRIETTMIRGLWDQVRDNLLWEPRQTQWMCPARTIFSSSG
jgi:phenolic acid decarboxylase